MYKLNFADDIIYVFYYMNTCRGILPLCRNQIALSISRHGLVFCVYLSACCRPNLNTQEHIKLVYEIIEC